MTQRLVVIGGDAAGMSAASQARRRRPVEDLEILAFEKSAWVSYSACGEPYHVAGDVDALEDLVARTPEEFGDRDIDVRIHHEVMEVDLDQRTLEYHDHREHRTGTVEFDQLMIGTGTRARMPDIEGLHLEAVHTLRTLDDAAVLRAHADGPPGTVVIAGGGYIGLETAEAFARRGWQVTLITKGDSVLTTTLDPDLGSLVIDALRSMSVGVITGERVECLNGRSGRVVSVGSEAQTIPADLVVVGLGSEPQVDLAERAGVPIGPTGAIAVDARQRTEADGVWAAGDCAEVRHRISGASVNPHLGTVANKTGRVAGINLGGGDATFPGVLGTVITRVGSTEIAATGLRTSEAGEAGLDPVEATAEGTTIAGYMPGAEPMRIRMVAERGDGRLLGAQIVGGTGAGKRIDVVATALWNNMRASDLAWADLAYAPPFSGVWDLLHIAARKVAAAAAR